MRSVGTSVRAMFAQLGSHLGPNAARCAESSPKKQSRSTAIVLGTSEFTLLVQFIHIVPSPRLHSLIIVIIGEFQKTPMNKVHCTLPPVTSRSGAPYAEFKTFGKPRLIEFSYHTS